MRLAIVDGERLTLVAKDVRVSRVVSLLSSRWLPSLSAAHKLQYLAQGDNKARNEGRYRLWSTIDLKSPRVMRLIDLMVRRGVFFSPNLAIFERRAGERGATEMHARACENMRAFTGMAR